MWTRLSKKKIILYVAAFLSLVCFAVLTLVASSLKNSLTDQNAGKRWDSDGSYSQVSVFFADNAGINFNRIMQFRSSIGNGLREASLSSEDENKRTFVDAYSSVGKVTLVVKQSRAEVSAMGVGGDFFFFHPFELISGTYFSDDALNKDGIVIDEETAWQLYGSADIIGMPVTINNVPHYIKGVIKRESGFLWEAAGLSESIVYLSHESLESNGTTDGIRFYETLMPNPVSGFAFNLVTDKLGLESQMMTVVDNTARYSLSALFQTLRDMPIRSMSSYAIRVPFWENYARGFEDILAFMLLFQVLFAAFPAVVLAVSLILAYQRRTWTYKGALLGGIARIGALAGKMARKRKKEEAEEMEEIGEVGEIAEIEE